jgi:hypothetical protein
MNTMFAKSTQVALASLFLVLAAMAGGCAESSGDTPVNFPSQRRPVAFLVRSGPSTRLTEHAFHSGAVGRGAPQSVIARSLNAKRH